MTSEITLNSPAKINLYLDVTCKRQDGFHELCTVMQEIDLCDTITVKVSKGDDIIVTAGSLGNIDGKKNICYKAVLLFKEKYIAKGGKQFAASIAIDKKIPMGGGLGGGSSNAAYVLRALNELFDKALTDDELVEISAQLGSDVAFFVKGGTALCLGRGEIIKKQLDVPVNYYVLFNPGIEIPTPSVYKNLKLTAEVADKIDIDTFMSKLDEEEILLYNFLETSVFDLYPQEKKIRDEFISVGAKKSIVSGSGATVLGLADSEEDALRIKAEMEKSFSGQAWVVKTYH